MSVFSTLDEAYEQAASIVLAQITGCQRNLVSQDGKCPDQLYTYDVIEVLKDTIPARDHSGEFKGSTPMGCGLIVRRGDNLLLFQDEAGKTSTGSENLNTGNAIGNYHLKILRQYRDGLVSDLSGPWRFSDWGILCRVVHQFDGGGLTFRYYYAEGDYDVYLDPQIGPDGGMLRNDDGELIYNLVPNPSGQREIEWSTSGPTFDQERFFLRVRFRDPDQVAERSISFSVGNETWSFFRQITTTSNPLVEPNSFITDVTAGKAVEEIFEALSAPTKIVISARTTSADSESPMDSESAVLNFTTRSTQFADARRKLGACIDGSERKANPRFP